MIRSPRRAAHVWLVAAILALAACAPAPAGPAAVRAAAVPAAVDTEFPPPIDPQHVRDQDDMTWDDYLPIPGADWTDTTRQGSKKQIRLAIVTADFPDQPFVLTLLKRSDLFGNPLIDPIKRDDIPRFFRDFYMVPGPLNHGHTIHEFWMEQSRGRIGVSTTAFGPYRMPATAFQYGLSTQADEPAGYKYLGGSRLPRDLDSAWRADKGQKVAQDFDLVLHLFAGYDETATWQEFGEMKFETKDDIPPEWGNPDASKPRWVRSRYGAWTPWKAGEWLWSNAGNGSITQGENINSIRHELGHAAFRIGDNYNNPFAEPHRRAPAGPWDLMDRGSFNGPGGPHARYLVPPSAGGSMAAGLMLRQRMLAGFVDSSQVLLVNRNGLAQTGVAVAEITARAVDPRPGTLSGVVVRLDGADSAHRDMTPVDDPSRNPLSAGISNYNTYTVEVVQRIGYDSYEPDHGVLIAKNKDRAAPVGGPNGYNVFTWVIDAHPEDINTLDFRRPHGEPVMRSIADYRQLNDALFHAGTNSGSFAEWEDAPNRLHFYIVETRRDARGVLSYTIAIRSLDGAGPHQRGVAVSTPATPTAVGARGKVQVTIGNTGTAAPVPAVHATRDPEYFGYDVYRLAVTTVGQGWHAALQNELAAIQFGGARSLPVFVSHDASAAPSATVTFTVTSESDPAKSATTSFSVRQ